MNRVNTFEVVPQTENDKECLQRLGVHTDT